MENNYFVQNLRCVRCNLKTEIIDNGLANADLDSKCYMDKSHNWIAFEPEKTEKVEEFKIKFIPATTLINEKGTFSMVEIDQFFIDDDGCFCQKICDEAYNCIADSNGFPYANTFEVENREKVIKRILPRIAKIES